MAAVRLIGGGPHALRTEPLQLGLDGPVVLTHDVPARLRLPGGAFNLLVEQVRGWHPLGRPDDLLLLLGQVSREALDPVRAQPNAPLHDLDVREYVCGGELFLQALRRLIFVRGECGDVDQPGNAVVGPRGCDDGSTVIGTNQKPAPPGSFADLCQASGGPPRSHSEGAYLCLPLLAAACRCSAIARRLLGVC